MRRRKDARQMAAVLDKARELSREEPSADWSETEWKKLMAAAVVQKIEGGEERAESKPKAVFWKPALAYGGAALIMMAIIGYTLRNSFFRPSASPPTDQIVAQKDEVPAAPVAKEAKAARPETSTPDVRAKESNAAKSLPAVTVKAQEAAASKPRPSVIQSRKPAPAGERVMEHTASGEAPGQDEVTVKLVSPDTGLQIVWVLNKNFEWKGENQ